VCVGGVEHRSAFPGPPEHLVFQVGEIPGLVLDHAVRRAGRDLIQPSGRHLPDLVRLHVQSGIVSGPGLRVPAGIDCYLRQRLTGQDVRLDDVFPGRASRVLGEHEVRRAEALAVKNDFAGGHRTGIGNLGVAGRDLPDVGRVVDDNALPDGKPQIFRSRVGLGRWREQQYCRRQTTSQSDPFQALIFHCF